MSLVYLFSMVYALFRRFSMFSPPIAVSIERWGHWHGSQISPQCWCNSPYSTFRICWKRRRNSRQGYDGNYRWHYLWYRSDIGRVLQRCACRSNISCNGSIMEFVRWRKHERRSMSLPVCWKWLSWSSLRCTFCRNPSTGGCISVFSNTQRLVTASWRIDASLVLVVSMSRTIFFASPVKSTSRCSCKSFPRVSVIIRVVSRAK